MADKSIGFIETYGLAAAIAAADAAVKSANVKLLGYEYAKGDGMCTVKVEGNVGACKAAIAAGTRAAELVNGTHKGIKSVLLKARPADGIMNTMVIHRENVGGDIALAEGYRPKGESRMPVLVKNWKPKETPIVKTPEPPVVEKTVEESDEEVTPIEVISEEVEAPVEAPVVEEEAPVEAPVVEETPVEAPEAEEETPVEAPEAEEPVAEEAPVEEEPVAEEAPAEEEAAVEETPAEEEAPKKTTSTGKRRSSRKKKNPDK